MVNLNVLCFSLVYDHLVDVGEKEDVFFFRYALLIRHPRDGSDRCIVVLQGCFLAVIVLDVSFTIL